MVSQPIEYRTQGGIEISRTSKPAEYASAIGNMLDRVDNRLGAVFSSNYEYPGRYTRWDTAIVDPPISIQSQGRKLCIKAHNTRGEVLLPAFVKALQDHEHIKTFSYDSVAINLEVKKSGKIVSEEMRSRAPTVFSIVRAVVDLFRSEVDPSFGLFGSFGYDLVFQFEDIEQKLERPQEDKDLVLFLPDEILVVDHHQAIAWHDRYEFVVDGKSTEGLSRDTPDEKFQPSDIDPPHGDHERGEYAAKVEKAKEKFKRGDLFEVVPGQTFYEKCNTKPSVISRTLKNLNPSPYSFFINLGNNEYLIGASPEMFVRVQGKRVETCPISGTIKRGADAIEDSEQILKLLNSKKDESELTMCSDVDRNDKSRVCEAGSVRVIGRRQIEMYSKLIHTVDHIEGRLRDG
ncbi:MAG: chorismate-binding protein, partial [Nitratireductor sp.]